MANQPTDTRIVPLRRRLQRWVRQLIGRRAAPASDAPYPDYVTCPHCGEPEVEVWCYDTTAHCHNCGRPFEHPRPPECADVPCEPPPG